MTAKKRLFRSGVNKIIFGIFGGLGEYLNLDPAILRLLFLFILIFTGFIPGLAFYFAAALIVPRKTH